MGPQNRTESKSLLARLLAGENITIIHEPIPTAMFDLEERELHLPVWVQEISSSLYTLMEAHEVGHALETPPEGWQNAIAYNCKINHRHDEACLDQNFGGYLNICEDARIERLIKQKYQGLRKHFLIGYKELYDQDFFGVKGIDPAELNLVDRINLYFKIGAHLPIPFEASERIYIDRLEKVKTFDEVVEIARAIYKECNQKQSGLKNVSQLGKFGGKAKKGAGSGDMSAHGSMQCITDRYFRETQQILSSKETCETGTLPEFESFEAIYSLDEVVSYYENQLKGNDGLYEEHSKNILNHFLGLHRDYINMLLQEFEMRKNATQYYRARQHRSGELDTRRLAHYQLTSDIFRRTTEVPKGKSHGFIMYLDMSGSMDGLFMARAVEQALILVTFCQKARIPFDLYGFADSNEYKRKHVTKPVPHKRDLRSGAIGGGSFHLRHLLSSKAMPHLTRRSMRMMAYYMGQHGNRSKCFHGQTREVINANVTTQRYGGLVTSGTPLSETIILSRTMIEKFKAKYQLDIVNVIYLTDGDGNGVQFPGARYWDTKDRFMIIDRKTKEFVYARSKDMKTQEALTQLVKQITGCRHIGYYICHDSSLVHHVQGSRLSTEEKKKALQTIKDYAFAAIPSLGFDCYYYISPRLMDASVEDINNSSYAYEPTDKLEKKLHRKKASRLILRQFAQQIATIDGLEDEYE